VPRSVGFLKVPMSEPSLRGCLACSNDSPQQGRRLPASNLTSGGKLLCPLLVVGLSYISTLHLHSYPCACVIVAVAL
jgi:hypothetical protein